LGAKAGGTGLNLIGGKIYLKNQNFKK